jgi:hypothetical protein
MAARPQLPGMRWFLWMRNDALRIGIYTGVCLSCVFVVWLLVANHIPQLEPFAGVRNLVAGAAEILLMAIPALRFRGQPRKLFASSLTAWTLLTLTYILMEMHYTLLASRIGAFRIFMLGGISICFVAVFQWVFLICAEARHRHMVQCAQDAVSESRHRIV